jgi:hypothetical protein
MKKISAVLLGLSLTLATAGLSLAAQAAAAPTDNSTPATTKKHVKKNKKAAAKTDAAKPATSATPAPAK